MGGLPCALVLERGAWAVLFSYHKSIICPVGEIFFFLNKGSVVANVIVISQSSTKYFMEVFLFHENF